MEKALAKIRNLIESNANITSKLSVYEGEPAFVFQTALKTWKSLILL